MFILSYYVLVIIYASAATILIYNNILNIFMHMLLLYERKMYIKNVYARWKVTVRIPPE